MKKLATIVTTLIVGSLAISAHANAQFNKDQLEQFEKTNKCSGCDLSGAYLESNHSSAVLTNANLSNMRCKTGDDMNFALANLQNANLSGAELYYANFSQADLTGAHFDGANLAGANFYGAIGANIKNAANLCDVTMPDGSRSECNGVAKAKK